MFRNEESSLISSWEELIQPALSLIRYRPGFLIRRLHTTDDKLSHFVSINCLSDTPWSLGMITYNEFYIYTNDSESK